ncbi:MAG TPA: 6-phosphogluconolactonase, partial [Acidimicrobiia bacterium]|nr:6-phosphogluconolactonase [Acidimicrobiia bacterium]
QELVRAAPRSVALSGGGTAGECYEEVARRPFDWSAVDIYFGDDRFVPPDHEDSNEGLARRTLLDACPPHSIHGMYHPGTVEAAADHYDALMRAVLPLDLVHLGLGPDGHTASLFPGSSALDEHERMVIAASSEHHPHPRVTFTFAAIEKCPLVLVTVAGAEKRDAMTRIAAGEDLPGARIRAERVVWLVDSAAAPEH